jgi:hypothetical protein
MIIKKITWIALFAFLLLIQIVSAQENRAKDADIPLKETLYKKYKKVGQAFDKKKFDALFFEFFQRQRDKEITLTKEEFYKYTLTIAAYSEKLGLLYKDQKEEAQRTKQEWFDKSYSEYLNFKK